MITGLVKFDEARIRLIVKGRQGREQEIDAVIDSGFSGALTLPPALIATLGRPRHRALLRQEQPQASAIPSVTSKPDGIGRNRLAAFQPERLEHTSPGHRPGKEIDNQTKP